MKIDTTVTYFLEEFKSYGGDMAENRTEAVVVEGSEIEETIKEWYSDYADERWHDVISGYGLPEDFIKELLKTGKSTAWTDNPGGSYDDPSSFGLVVTELSLYKEIKLALLRDEIKAIEALV